MSTESGIPRPRRDALHQYVEISTLYHHKRERCFALVGRSASLVSIVGGSSAIAAIAANHDIVAAAMGALVVITSAVVLVFRIADRAREHACLAQQSGRLQAEIILTPGERAFTEADHDA